MNKTKIDWCDYTWNPITGCRHGCPYCYARRLTVKRQGDFTPTIHFDRLNQPAQVKKPSRIFVCSMADMWGDWVLDMWIRDVLAAAAHAPQHTYFFLTKNPKRYRDFKFPCGFWRGTSAENQEAYDERAPYLAGQLETFLSLEPLHGPIKLVHDIDWVIVGAETGERKERVLIQGDWVSEIVRTCKEANPPVPVYIKRNVSLGGPKEFPKKEESHGRR